MDYLEDLIDLHGGAENVELNVGTKAEPIPVLIKGGEAAQATERLARGETDDVFEGLPEETVADIKRHMGRKHKKVEAAVEPPPEDDAGFADDYTKGP